MARYLLDTDTFIYIRRRRSRAVLARFAALSPGDAGISVISYGELMFGAEKSRERERALRDYHALASALPVMPLPGEAGQHYGRLRADLGRRGMLIGNNDLWIAAHALAANLVLVTNNEREFRRIPGLKIENWAR